jgi:hypothetical protein
MVDWRERDFASTHRRSICSGWARGATKSGTGSTPIAAAAWDELNRCGEHVDVIDVRRRTGHGCLRQYLILEAVARRVRVDALLPLLPLLLSTWRERDAVFLAAVTVSSFTTPPIFRPSSASLAVL